MLPLLLRRSCPCAGCAAQAMHAVTTGQKRVAQLLASPELSQPHDGQEVGCCCCLFRAAAAVETLRFRLHGCSNCTAIFP